jgi:hypothetical protein
MSLASPSRACSSRTISIAPTLTCLAAFHPRSRAAH